MFDENCFFSSGAPAARQSGARDPGPRWAGALQPGTRAARPPTAPGGQGGPSCAPEQSLHPLPPVGRVAPAARQSGVRAPGPRIPFWNLHTLKEKHIPRVNEYQS